MLYLRPQPLFVIRVDKTTKLVNNPTSSREISE